MALGNNISTFHEIRSLARRLYEKERGRDLRRNCWGTSSEMMTLKYLKTRGEEYVML
ncbi:integrase [Serratia sp. OMLW3]|nr:integrase [Serratia sp. OMLW3]PIJ14207.1 integrase [Serratia sp. OLAL2]